MSGLFGDQESSRIIFYVLYLFLINYLTLQQRSLSGFVTSLAYRELD